MSSCIYLSLCRINVGVIIAKAIGGWAINRSAPARYVPARGTRCQENVLGRVVVNRGIPGIDDRAGLPKDALSTIAVNSSG